MSVRDIILLIKKCTLKKEYQRNKYCHCSSINKRTVLMLLEV